MLKWKLVALCALTTAARAQGLSALNIDYMSVYDDKIIFQIQTLLKTSISGVPYYLLCLFINMRRRNYIDRIFTQNKRHS
jgi:hypothetical protein